MKSNFHKMPDGDQSELDGLKSCVYQ